jgi:hypothetical protein
MIPQKNAEGGFGCFSSPATCDEMDGWMDEWMGWLPAGWCWFSGGDLGYFLLSCAGLKKPAGLPWFTAVTALTGPVRFRSGPIRVSPNSNLKFEKKNAEKIPKNSP